MFVRGKLNNLNDFFRSSAERTEKCVYFYRINGYNGDVDNLISRFEKRLEITSSKNIMKQQ